MTIELKNGIRTAFFRLGAIIALAGTVLAVLAVYSEHRAIGAGRIIDDPATEELDLVPLAPDTLASYRAALGAFGTAAWASPLHAGYRRSMAGLHSRIGIWHDTLREMRADLSPEGGSVDDHAAAFVRLREAVRRDPSDPEYRLAMAQLLVAQGRHEEARTWLSAAVAAYPVNAQLRYAAASLALSAGWRDDARNQALQLVMLDDSYWLSDEDPSSVLMREQRSAAYMDKLSHSYFTGALEVLWRVGAFDEPLIRSTMPLRPEAEDAVQLFLKSKGAL